MQPSNETSTAAASDDWPGREGLPGSPARWGRAKRLLTLASGALLAFVLVLILWGLALTRTGELEIVAYKGGSVTFLVPVDFALLRGDPSKPRTPPGVWSSVISLRDFTWRQAVSCTWGASSGNSNPVVFKGPLGVGGLKADPRGTLYAVDIFPPGGSGYAVTLEQSLRVSLGRFSFSIPIRRTRFINDELQGSL